MQALPLYSVILVLRIFTAKDPIRHSAQEQRYESYQFSKKLCGCRDPRTAWSALGPTLSDRLWCDESPIGRLYGRAKRRPVNIWLYCEAWDELIIVTTGSYDTSGSRLHFRSVK